MSDDPVTRPLLEESAHDLYEHAPCGYLSLLADGRIIKINETLVEWTGHTRRELLAWRFYDLLSGGGRIYYNTHLEPLLRMSGRVREIALDLKKSDGDTVPVLLNAVRREIETPRGPVAVTRLTLIDATHRRQYERELLEARRRAEEAFEHVRRLQELMPICAWCRRVRSDDGYWEEVGAYLAARGASVTHGICADCATTHLGLTEEEM